MKRIFVCTMPLLLMPLANAEQELPNQTQPQEQVQTLVQKSFYLKSGDKITGFVTNETDNEIQVQSAFGLITLQKNELQSQDVEVHLKNGDRVKGVLEERNDEFIVIETRFGKMTFPLTDVDQIKANKQTDFTPKVSDNSELQSQRWYFSENQLIDVWADPTGYNLKKSEFYFSGLSWAIGLTDRFQISSRWVNYFYADFNIRPKFQLFETGNVDSKQAMAVGAHIHTGSLPDKYEKALQYDEYSETYSEQYKRIGKGTESYGLTENESKAQLWGEVFGAYTYSKARANDQGYVNYTVGGSATYYPEYDIMPRAYIAFDTDIRETIKLMGEIAWDPYYRGYYDDNGGVSDQNFFLDMGFMTNALTKNEKLWFGLHFQRPTVSFYYKF